MKNYHPIGKPFKFKTNGEELRLVAVECETMEYNGQTYRKTCKGCVFAYRAFDYSCGYCHKTIKCRQGDCKNAKCGPDREDGKMIHYKVITAK